MNTMTKQFKKLSVAFDKLRNSDLEGDDYICDWETLRIKFHTFIMEYDFTELTKQQFLRLCQIVSRDRPIEPFRFLIRIDVLLDNKLNQTNETTN